MSRVQMYLCNCRCGYGIKNRRIFYKITFADQEGRCTSCGYYAPVANLDSVDIINDNFFISRKLGFTVIDRKELPNVRNQKEEVKEVASNPKIKNSKRSKTVVAKKQRESTSIKECSVYLPEMQYEKIFQEQSEITDSPLETYVETYKLGFDDICYS